MVALACLLLVAMMMTNLLVSTPDTSVYCDLAHHSLSITVPEVLGTSPPFLWLLAAYGDALFKLSFRSASHQSINLVHRYLFYYYKQRENRNRLVDRYKERRKFPEKSSKGAFAAVTHGLLFWQFLVHKLASSFFWDITLMLFSFVLGTTQLALAWINLPDEASYMKPTSISLDFGQLVSILFLLLPVFAAIELFYGKVARCLLPSQL